MSNVTSNDLTASHQQASGGVAGTTPASPLTTAEREAAELAVAVAKTIKDFRTGGIKSAAGNLPALAKEGGEAFAAARAVLPALKSGKTTSEFLLTVAVILGIVIARATGHPLPVETEIVLGAMSGLYMTVRTIIKAKAAPPAA